MSRPPIVSLVGAGPGDPGLLTLRGQELLAAADVVVYDHLVSDGVLTHARPQAKRIYVGKQASHHTLSQEKINALLIKEAKAGRRVVRLKGGDPTVFGRGGEEALALAKAGIRFEIIPGITSAIAAATYAGIPVTHREMASSMAILTGHEDPSKPSSAIRWDRLATACDTIVCLMGVGTLPEVTQQLIRHGRASRTPAAVIEWGTTPRQRTITGTLATIAGEVRRAKLQPPAVLVVGEGVKLRDRLNWFETKPLFAHRILVTRAADKAQELAGQLEALGAAVERLPAIELVSVAANGAFKQAVQALPQTDWVFFTSPEGLGWFTKMLKPYRKDARSLAGCRIGAIGPKTALAIEQAGLHVDFVPRRYSQEGVLQDLPKQVLAGRRAVIFSAEGSRDVLTKGLKARGMRVAKVPIYRTRLPAALKARITGIAAQPWDLVTATSASCVDHFSQALRAVGKGTLIKQLRFASIGPVTSQAVRAAGGRVAVEATVSTIDGLVEAIQRYAMKGRR